MKTSELKNQLIEQLSDEFENPTISPFSSDWEKGVDLLFDVIRLSDFYSKFITVLEDILINNTADYNSLVNFASYLENYLVRVGYLLGITIEKDRWRTLTPILTKLGLHDDYSKFSREKLAIYENKPNCLAHFCRSYFTRNELAHSKKDGSLPNWAKKQIPIMQNRNSILVVMVYATLKHYDALQRAIANQENKYADVDSYLTKVIDDFKNWEQLFVNIHGSEKIELYAREELDKPDGLVRTGTIDDLRKEIPKLMIVGDAGMGKTTTLEYLAYKDAIECQNNSENNIPLYLALKRLGSDNVTLISKILNELRCFSDDFIEGKLKHGKMSLFLDGLNELRDSQIGLVETQIQDLLDDYPKIKLIVSSRRSHKFNLTKTKRMPVFGLNQMKPKQIEDFVTKNTLKSTADIILEEMKVNKIFADWLTIPMLLKMIIQVVEDRQKISKYQHEPIPNSTSEFIGNFIDRLYRREKERDSRFSDIAFESLTTHLATKIFAEKKSNTPISLEEAIRILTERQENSFSDTNLDYFLRVSTEIGTLTKHDDGYSFAHEKYFDYYQAKGMVNEKDEFDF